ncbi:hypothetical protein NQ317_018347 [Molorchus minor]|uniref:Uncharacterized protein n=1 Tax=Molorchus minor TaxID=1323400 RepID=A0ABQ9IWP7_9CUCU|nr:hypothetical protein NQ317_018347 [Molorchus minor]
MEKILRRLVNSPDLTPPDNFLWGYLKNKFIEKFIGVGNTVPTFLTKMSSDEECITGIHKRRKTGPGNLSIRIKHIVIGPGLQLLLQRPSLAVQLVGLVCNSISEETGSKLVKGVLKKTCLSGVKIVELAVAVVQISS